MKSNFAVAENSMGSVHLEHFPKVACFQAGNYCRNLLRASENAGEGTLN